MDTQKRAKSGGEFGPNGEWYPGGAFIATTEQPKSAPAEKFPSRTNVALYEEAARIASWLEGRRQQFEAVVTALTANTAGVSDEEWNRRVEDHAAGFLPSLGRTLYMTGSLSAKQAEFVAKTLVGRKTKATTEAFEALVDSLTESYS